MYKQGKDNGAADALSRLPAEGSTTHQLRTLTTLTIPDWVEPLRKENEADPWLLKIRQQLRQDIAKEGFVEKDGLIFFNLQFCLGPSSSLREVIMNELQETRIGGHSGVFHTLARVRLRFFWEGMVHDVQEFISHSQTCQQVKPPSAKPDGLLQPLKIHSAIQEKLCMDFVTGFPLVAGKSIIMVIVDRFSKYCHLGALPTGYTTTTVAQHFIHQIVQLCGMSKTIISNCDRVFMSKFWKKLLHHDGTTHPQHVISLPPRDRRLDRD